jgi:hypothetical protein
MSPNQRLRNGAQRALLECFIPFVHMLKYALTRASFHGKYAKQICKPCGEKNTIFACYYDSHRASS